MFFKVFGLFYGLQTFCKSLMLVMVPKKGGKRDKFNVTSQ